MRVATEGPFLPSGDRLAFFPDPIVEEMRSIALAVLRRLFYPVLRRQLAALHRRRALESWRRSEDLAAAMRLALEQLSAPVLCAQTLGVGEAVAQASGAVERAVASADYRLFAEGEMVQYAGEPGNAVVVLLVGSVKKRAWTVKTRRKSVLERPNSLPSTAPIAVIPFEEASQMSRRSSTRSLRHSSVCIPQVDTPPKFYAIDAPAVFGENTTVGGYPCTEHLVAESPVVVTAVLSREAYCEVLGAFPKPIQQQVLLMALKSREKLIPRFAPMNFGRMRLCPLLTELSDDSLRHLMDYLVPCMRAAGMQIGELDNPKHIFFIRRGVVHVRGEEALVADVGSPTQARSRSLLLEGHTFGERQCIFREALGDSFYALTNVDLYLLPFSVLIQFMKQQPDARTTIYASAKAASLVLESDYEGMRFVPASLEKLGLVLLGPAQLSKWFQRRVNITTASSRRTSAFCASILDVGSAKAPMDCGAVGVSPHFLEQIRRIPLLNLCSPTDAFYAECALHWETTSYEAGEYIVRRGSECNRLLLFSQGGAAVVLEEKKVAEGLVNCPPTASQKELSVVPRECIIGYTCVRRHPWMLSVIAVENQVEVWEMKRVTFVELLRKHQLERKMQELVQQLMQPLMQLQTRSKVLDMQPLLAPSPNSLWSECRLPNLHPVSLCEYLRFPAWREGDLPRPSSSTNRRSSIW
ncbi:uncharacterized protein Tco025E_02570 [Trypanosoma conorhini]|uniref:Cyclic nucleotide-binding domain-containing protein n=1 Tax=Trypanosoma conorhini TaxID=83891 RepID=A0A422Q2T4_9TRYP|nr:uncharacterized protein Tco025E_02570 [Trypanosoma conorhini]RNF24281.1 hypothetical protein Tco025E_02570 [Trypanosoma conorhini]